MKRVRVCVCVCSFVVKAARTTAFKGPSVTLSKHLCFTQLFLSDSVSSHFYHSASFCHHAKLSLNRLRSFYECPLNTFGSASTLTRYVSIADICGYQKTAFVSSSTMKAWSWSQALSNHWVVILSITGLENLVTGAPGLTLIICQ